MLTGRVFSGESMFHRVSGASKVAVVDLCDRLRRAGVVLIDTEEQSEHLQQLGQVHMARENYVDLVQRVRDQVAKLPRDRRPVNLLLPGSGGNGFRP